MLDATALSILPIVMAPLLGGAFALLPFQLARGCLEGVIQPRVLSAPASAGGPHQQGAVVGLRQTGQRLTSIPIPALMGGIPERVRSPRVVGSPCTAIDAQMDRLIARFVVQHADRGPTARSLLPPAVSPWTSIAQRRLIIWRRWWIDRRCLQAVQLPLVQPAGRAASRAARLRCITRLRCMAGGRRVS
jgi:hypothetical protein